MPNTTQTDLFDTERHAAVTQPIECLGVHFPDAEARREHFLEKLHKDLKDTAFRGLEGFPIGDDEDILRLSDPPYYTACPNPFLKEFVSKYGKPFDSTTDQYQREPFAADVSEGKRLSLVLV